MTSGKYIRTKEINEKIRKAQLKRYEDPDAREKIRQANIKRFQDHILIDSITHH